MKRFNKFIASTTQISTFSKPIQAPYFRKSFNLKTKDKTVLYIAVAGLYELYFNGNKISEIQINGDSQKIRIPPALIRKNQTNEVTIKTGRNLMQTAYIDYDDIEFMNLFLEN